jgi:uncharacterized protein YjbI with pentapeptide repeats/DNA-binding Xre family transcriptional regulator
MTDSSLPKKRKKVTFTASKLGIEKAENALKRLGFESKINFAKSQLISRSTVTKFFQCEPVQLDSFKKICAALTLNWSEIAGMIEAEEREYSLVLDRNISDVTKEMGNMQILSRQITVVDRTSEKIKAVITLQGDIDSVDNWKIFQSVLRQYSGSSINIVDIESGSIRLTIHGSQEDIQKLVSQIRLSELTEINTLPIESIEILNEILNPKKDDKWELVKEIIDPEVINRNLSDTDLSDADLSGADLSSAYLIGADLSGADLNNANLNHANLDFSNLSNANLCDADLIGAFLSVVNLSGAQLVDANLKGAFLNGANLSAANLHGAFLDFSELSGGNLSGADLSSTFLIDANLSFANLSGANLSDANLIDTNLRGTNLSFANLSDTNLSGANLCGAYLMNTNLCDAYLIGADLSLVNLSGANLNGANLIDTNLNNAYMSGTNVENTRFRNNQGISESMKLDLIKKGAIFEDYPGDRSETYALR